MIFNFGFWIEEEMLTQRSQRSLSPDAGRGADAQRDGIPDFGRWVGGERCLILDVEFLIICS